MDYINIVSKEEIEVLPNWAVGVLFTILMLIVLIPTFISWIVVEKKNLDRMNIIWAEIIAGGISIICGIVFCVGLQKFFLEPSGRFRYKATVDKDNITVSEYEDFIERYRPEIKDGIYYFETDDVLEEDK
jgi:uncharacterized membrane protein